MSYLKKQIREAAKELGFIKIGFARVEALETEGQAFKNWIESGYHGSMQWMADTADVRVDPMHEKMLPSVRSIIVLATSYAGISKSIGPKPGKIARYARGKDYHRVLGKKAKKLAAILREKGHEARVSVDTMPVLERVWAQRAGIGFVGKNSCLIVPGLGSHVFLSCILTSAEIEPDASMKSKCGSCTLCLDICPTNAFKKERLLDANKCISYLTIEHRGEIKNELKDQMGDWFFGCDDCQDVCPYNQTHEELNPDFEPHERWQSLTAEDFLQMNQEQFEQVTLSSPLRRAKREGLARNAAVVLANTQNKKYLPVLQNAAENHDSEMVRNTAVWAVEKISNPENVVRT